jgi:signal transduction histidine kinase
MLRLAIRVRLQVTVRPLTGHGEPPTIQDQMQQAEVPAGTSNRGTRVASLGLAGVVLCLAVFSIVAAYTTQTQVDRAQRSAALAESYADAISVLDAEETSKLEYLLEPSTQSVAALEAAGRALTAAVNEIAIRGGREDGELVRDMLALHDRYLVGAERLLGAMGAGNRTEALRIDRDEAQPLFRGMHDRLSTATEERLTQERSALAELQATTRWLLILSPVVFAVGFALMLGLWRRLEHYHRATRETYRHIEQLSKLRSEFVSIVSHEFRTPLTGIQGFSEMMRDEDLPLDTMREYAGDINKDAKRLAELLSDMLDLDGIESGQVRLSVEPVDLNGIVVDAAARYRLTAPDHPIELHLDERLPKLMGDTGRMTQVVTNLLSNAIKYSPNGGAVELRTSRQQEAVMLTVRDHGIGIPAEQLEKILERYPDAGTDATSIRRTGLGLPLVRQIVEMYSGKVWATSESGQGSVFHVQLPLPDPPTLAIA